MEVKKNTKMKKKIGKNVIFQRLFNMYNSSTSSSTNTSSSSIANCGITLNGLGQIFHDINIGDNFLTICDLGKKCRTRYGIVIYLLFRVVATCIFK